MKSSSLNHLSVFFAVSIMFVACYSFIDQPLAIWLHQHSLTVTTAIAGFISTHFRAETFYLLPLLTIAYCMIRRQTSSIMCRQSLLLVTIFFINAVLCTVLKILFSRARPYEWFSHHAYGFHFAQLKSAYWSFPSGHAFVASTFFSFIALSKPRYRWWCLLGVLLMCVSRMIVAAHYLGDVMVGSFLGYWTCRVLMTRYAEVLPFNLDLKLQQLRSDRV